MELKDGNHYSGFILMKNLLKKFKNKLTITMKIISLIDVPKKTKV